MASEPEELKNTWFRWPPKQLGDLGRQGDGRRRGGLEEGVVVGQLQHLVVGGRGQLLAAVADLDAPQAGHGVQERVAIAVVDDAALGPGDDPAAAVGALRPQSDWAGRWWATSRRRSSAMSWFLIGQLDWSPRRSRPMRAKKVWESRIGLGAPFGVPLDSDHRSAVGPGRDGFDETVRRYGLDGQALAQAVDGLVMHRIDLQLVAAIGAGQHPAGARLTSWPWSKTSSSGAPSGRGGRRGRGPGSRQRRH